MSQEARDFMDGRENVGEGKFLGRRFSRFHFPLMTHVINYMTRVMLIYFSVKKVALVGKSDIFVSHSFVKAEDVGYF